MITFHLINLIIFPTDPLAAHMYTQAFNHFAAASYINALTRRPEPEIPPPASNTLWPPDLAQSGRSPSPSSEDSRDAPSLPLHLVSEEATRRRREEEAEERRREAEVKRERSYSPQPRSPSPRTRSPLNMRSPLSKIPTLSSYPKCSPQSPMLTEPPPSAPLTPPPARELRPPLSSSSGLFSSSSHSTSGSSTLSVGSKTTMKPRSGPKPKPSPLSIEAITGSSPVISPRQFSASSLNTPLVNLPSPPYSGVGTKSPFLPLTFWQNLSPLASLSPHYSGSPRGGHHFTFPVLPTQFSHLHPPVSPLLHHTPCDFSALASPTDKPATVHVLQ